MAIIPGSIPVTGFIAPTDTTDSYAVTDAIYGIDGLRNVADHTERDNISLERRRAGMVVGTLNDSTYWRLKNQSWTLGDPGDWELFAVGGGGSSSGNLYYIDSSVDIVVPLYSQYWIYGDLTIVGQLTNYGQVVIADGSMTFGTMSGTFSNFGTLSFVTINGTAQNGASYSFENSPTVEFALVGSTVSAQVITSSLTASHFNSINGATAGYILSVTSTGQFEWIPAAGSGTITSVNPGIGLTGGGNSGSVTLDVNVNNGLSIDVSNNIILGGTLSQFTTINATGYGFEILGLDNIMNISSSGDGFLGLYAGGAGLDMADNSGDPDIAITFGGGTNIYLSSSEMAINDIDNNKGFVYGGDYTANFTTHSLVTKGYVDSVLGTSSGTSSIFGADNGLSIDNLGDIILGGTLSQDTTINGDNYTLSITGLSGSSTNIISAAGGDALLRISETNVELGNYTTKGGVQINTNTSTVGVYENFVSINTSATYSNEISIDIDSIVFSIDSVNTFGIYESSNSQSVSDASSDNLFVIKDSNSKGIVYDNDYTSNFTDNSLITKQYVDNLIGSSSSISANNGLSIEMGSVILGGTLSQDTTIHGDNTYILSIIGLSGSNVNTVSAGQVSLNLQEGQVELNDYSSGAGIYLNTSSSSLGIGENSIGLNVSSSEFTTGVDYIYLSVDFGTSIFGVYATSNSQTLTGGDPSTNNLFVVKDSNSKGIVYDDDYTANFTNNSLVTKQYVDGVSGGKPSSDDKSISALSTSGDGQFSGATISNTPVDGGYITIYINGMEFVCGNGVTSNVDCYFSVDGGVNARGFSSSHPNGSVQQNDELYWNGVYAGTDLSSGWRISIHYLV